MKSFLFLLHVVVSKPDASSAEGRLEWIGEMNKESKREARRNKEQNVRNTRLLYELQQKVITKIKLKCRGQLNDYFYR